MGCLVYTDYNAAAAAAALCCRSRLGCQVVATKELDGLLGLH
jgi:hypothetical protein